MKKRAFLIIMALLLIAFSSVSVSAATSNMVRLNDGAQLLTADQRQDVTDALEKASKKLKMDVLVVTVKEIPSEFPEVDDRVDRFAASLIEGKDAILFLFVDSGGEGNRDYVFARNGEAKKVFDGKIDSIEEKVISYIGNGRNDFYGAFKEFADVAGSAKDFRFGLWGAIAAVIGAIAGAIRSGGLKSELKSVYSKDEAKDYIKRGSFVLNKKYDIPTYVTIDRQRVTRSDSSGNTTTVVTSSGEEIHTTHGKV